MNLSEADKKRIFDIQKVKWVSYTKANEVIKVLDGILKFPRTHRTPNLLIIGDTNNGKTLIGKRFENLNPVHFIQAKEETTNIFYQKLVKEVFMIQCPPVPNEKRLYIAILDKLEIPFKHSGRIEYLQSAALGGMRRLQAKILILDEIHHILTGSPAKQREFLNVLKFISNELDLSIVGIGTKDAFYVINSDEQLANRFEKVILNKWKYDTDYLRLLATLESQIKLKKPSNLIESEVSQKILEMSEGLIGEIVTIVKKCAIHAIESGEENISIKTLKEINWVAPAKRRSNDLLK